MSILIGAPNRALPRHQGNRLAETGPDAAWNLSTWDGFLRHSLYIGLYSPISHTPRQKTGRTTSVTGIPQISAHVATRIGARAHAPVTEGPRRVHTSTGRPLCPRESESEWKPGRGACHEENMRAGPAGRNGYARGRACSFPPDILTGIIRSASLGLQSRPQVLKGRCTKRFPALRAHESGFKDFAAFRATRSRILR